MAAMKNVNDFSDFKSKNDSKINKTTHGQKKNNNLTVWMRSCEEEIIDPIKGKVKGVIPIWIDGSLLQNGPGTLKVGEMKYNHVFDGLAMLHRFDIKNGSVTYQCRFLQSSTYKKNMTANKIVVTEFGTQAVPDPCHSIFDKVSAIFNPADSASDNASISIYPLNDEYFAFYETAVIHKIDEETLETMERVNLYPNIGVVTFSAHPHLMTDGSMFNMGLTVGKSGPIYNIIHFPRGDRIFEDAKIVASIPARWRFNPGYMHSFGITENYFILVEQPFALSLGNFLKGSLKSEPLINSLKFYDDYQTYFYVIDRKSGKLSYTFCADSFLYFHIINQYEAEDHIVLDICCYKNADIINLLYVESMTNSIESPFHIKMFDALPKRFVLPLKVSDHDQNLVTLSNCQATAYKLSNKMVLCNPEVLCNVGCDMPRIAYEKYSGKDYQFFYACSELEDNSAGSIIKVNVKDKTNLIWSEPNCFPSEPIFVPCPDAREEDDGVIICTLLWAKGTENKVGCLVLSAKNLKELGRCEFNTPSPAPKCFHGWFAQRH